VSDLLHSVRPRLHAYSRTRLVELLCALARLGVRLQLGGSDGDSSDGGQASTASSAGVQCEAGSDGDGERVTPAAATCMPEGSEPEEERGTTAAATSACVSDGARDFVADALSCFSSRHFRAPLPRHVAVLAGALACLVCGTAGEDAAADADPDHANAHSDTAGVQGRRPPARQGEGGVGPPGWGPDLAAALERALPPEALAACLPRLTPVRRAAAEAALTRLGVRLPVEDPEGAHAR
jgi:hypothetical protein